MHGRQRFRPHEATGESLRQAARGCAPGICWRTDEDRGDLSLLAVPPLRRLMPATGPQRAMAAATLFNMTGSGMFLASSALFFTRVVGFSVTQVGAGLTAGSLVGLISGVPVGRLADRRGARETYAAVKTLGALTIVSFAVVRSFWLFTLVACLNSLVASASTASRAPLVRQVGKDNPARFRAYLRSYANLGLALGALAAGLVVQLDTPFAYFALIVCNSVSSVVCAIVVRLFVPRTVPSAPAARGGKGAWRSVRDVRYLEATGLNSLMTLHATVPTYVLPLWIADHTHAPRWAISSILVINTVMVVLLQVRMSAGVDNAPKAASMMRRAGLTFLVACVVFALSNGQSTWTSLALILLGTVAYTLGELWHATSSFELMFRLAPEDAQGEYVGLFGLGQGLAEALSPTLVGLLCLTLGRPGWLILGLLLAAVGALTHWRLGRRSATTSKPRKEQPQHA